MTVGRKRLWFIGNSQDSSLRNVTLYLWQLTDCPSYGYISNISSVYVYVSGMCVNRHLYETGVFARIETWLLKMKKPPKLARVCVAEYSKRSFDYGIWLWNTTEQNLLWLPRLVELVWWGKLESYHIFSLFNCNFYRWFQNEKYMQFTNTGHQLHARIQNFSRCSPKDNLVCREGGWGSEAYFR